MAIECIHGFAEGLCDSCYPKPAPEPQPRSAAKQRPNRGSTVARSTPSRPAPVNVAGQRIYHLTHINNLESILEAGELRAPAVPVMDISSEITRELRRTAEVVPGISVADHVPFFLSPDATLWDELRAGGAGVTWSADARGAVPSDFVMIVTTLGEIVEPVLTDGDAAGTMTRFGTNPDASERMLRRLHDDEFSLLEAEVLAPGSVAFDSVTIVGVANDPMRDRVKAMLDGAGFTTKVAVYPPWFQPTA